MPYWDDIPAGFGGEVFYAIAAVDGEIEQVLLPLPFKDNVMVVAANASTVNPVGNGAVNAISSDGELVGVADVEVEDSQDLLRVRVVRADGELVFDRQLMVETVPLPSTARDSLKELAAARLGNRDLLRAFESAVDATRIYPPLTEMIIGRDGTVFIGLTEREGIHPYVVLGPEGDVMGIVDVRAGARIAEAERDRIWVIEPDEYDVESLVIYRVDWKSL